MVICLAIHRVESAGREYDAIPQSFPSRSAARPAAASRVTKTTGIVAAVLDRPLLARPYLGYNHSVIYLYVKVI